MNHAASLAHPSVRAYMARHGIADSALRSDGRLFITIDERWRVQIKPGVDRGVLLQARLLDPGPAGPRQADEALLRLGARGAGLLREFGSTLAIDPREGALVLQECLPAETDLPALETAIAGFANALAYWGAACDAERAHFAH